MTRLGDVLSLSQARLSDLGVDVPGITDPSEAFFKDGQWGWDLTRWRKLPLVFGYTGTVAEEIANNDLSQNDNDVDSSTVPAGYIWVITNIGIRYSGTPPTRISAALVLDGSKVFLYRLSTVVSGAIYDRQGWWVLNEDDLVRLEIVGATAGDDGALYITGFSMAIAQ